jgi:gamma-polyglutamate biosynthesis protein CapC
MVFPVVSSTILTFGVFIGIAVSMLWWEKELLSPGGVVVPGYTALFLLTNPLIIVYTLGVAVLTAVAIRTASRFSILYGRRRFAVTMLTALTLTFAVQQVFVLLNTLLPSTFSSFFTGPVSFQGFQVVGIIIPGLIANEIHRQGLVPTLSTLAMVSVITALIVYVIAILL